MFDRCCRDGHPIIVWQNDEMKDCPLCASKAKVEQRADNTGSPKLPPYVNVETEFIKWWRENVVIDNPSSVSLRKFYEIIERQLRTGA